MLFLQVFFWNPPVAIKSQTKLFPRVYPWHEAPVGHSCGCVDNKLRTDCFHFPLSLPHSCLTVSWGQLIKKLLALESLSQGLLPRKSKLKPLVCVALLRFSHSVVSDSLWPHGLQHTRLPCPSPTPKAYSNSCPSSRWCHPTISSFVTPFSPWPLSFPASESFTMSQLFPSAGQSIGTSSSASVLPMNI